MKRKIKIEYPVVMLLGCIFVLLTSFSTSPLFKGYGNDSAQFMTIGMSWAEGLIPYVDVFDHKGPLIFFVNMLGFKLTGGKEGVCIIQLCFMMVTAALLLKLAKLESRTVKGSLLIACFALFGLVVPYYEGNSTEEYCLPFLIISTYGQVHYLSKYVGDKTKNNEHPPFWAMIYGLSFSVCFLTRVTNAVAIGAGILVIAVLLVTNKMIKSLLQNMAMFIVGFVVGNLPFVIYFLSKGAFGEFIYGTIGYNLLYQENMTSWIENVTWDAFLEFGSIYYPCWILLVVVILAVYNKRNIMAVYSAIVFLLELYLFTRGAIYYQYAIITIPNMVLLGNEIFAIHNSDKAGKIIKKIGILCILFITLIEVKATWQRVEEHLEYESSMYYVYDELLCHIPEEEKDSFVAYGNNDLKSIYLRRGQVPYYKYFAIQEWHGYFAEKVREDIYETFDNGDVEWILINGDAGLIADVIIKKYTLIAESEGYYLYHACDNTPQKEIEDGWYSVAGYEYFYKDGKRLGYDPYNNSYRGEEFYDEEADAWYWLDNGMKGAKVKNKDVFLLMPAGEYAENQENGIGKWVRYDENGKMIRGWDYTENGIYYFDEIYGTMIKGEIIIDGVKYYFDEVTGKLKDEDIVH